MNGVFAICLATLTLATSVQAQSQSQFGGQDRADAAARLIVLAVERAVDSLPLISGQSVSYEFDPTSDAFRRSTHLGPTVLRSSQTIKPGTVSVQLAASYLDLAQSFRPINYLFTFDEPQPRQVVAKFGLDADARVGLLNVSATYGLSNRLEVSASLPLIVVDAHATQSFSTRGAEGHVIGVQVQGGNVGQAIGDLDVGLRPGGPLGLRHETFTNLGFDFNEGTEAGVGRISLGGKGVVLSRKALQVAFMSEFLLPSPSEGAFAGAGSAAILPRLAATLKLADWMRLHTDLGYAYDFDSAELRRLAWSAGGSLASQRAAFDLGLGGSEFDAPVRWTPSIIRGRRTASIPATIGRALEDNTTGTSLVNLLIGMKLRLTDATVIAGGVSIPVVNPSFEPDVLGTIAIDWSL